MKKPKILLIDDNETFIELFLCHPETAAYDIVSFTSAAQAITYLETGSADLVVSDVEMPEMNGIELFARIQDLYPGIPVILITAYGTLEVAVSAIKQGAYHYFEKPIDSKLDLFWATIREAIEKRMRLEEIASLRKEKSLRMKAPVSIVGQSAAIKAVFESINEIAALPVTVLICGETGTGKELVARAIHDLSQRGGVPFSRSTAMNLHQAFWRANCSVTKRGPLPAPLFKKKGFLKWPTRGRCFSMKSAMPRPPCSPSCCGFWKPGNSRGLAGSHPFLLIFVSLRQPTRIWHRKWKTDISGRTFYIA